MKKWKLILAAGIMAFACAGCGAQTTGNVLPAQDDPAVEAEAENEPSESEAEETDDSNTAAEEKGAGGETEAFAEQIQAAMADQDLEALADLCAYPLAVNGEVVESREAFMELGVDVIFTEERCAVIAAVDVSTLEETKAGFIMGDATPNIIFRPADGKPGITGIN